MLVELTDLMAVAAAVAVDIPKPTRHPARRATFGPYPSLAISRELSTLRRRNGAWRILVPMLVERLEVLVELRAQVTRLSTARLALITPVQMVATVVRLEMAVPVVLAARLAIQDRMELPLAVVAVAVVL